MARARMRDSADGMGAAYLPDRHNTTSSNFARQLESAINQVGGTGRRLEDGRALRQDHAYTGGSSTQPAWHPDGDPAWSSTPAANTRPAGEMEPRMRPNFAPASNVYGESLVDLERSKRLSNQTRAVVQPGAYVEQMQGVNGSAPPGFLVDSARGSRIQPLPAINPNLSPAGNYILDTGPQPPHDVGPNVQYGYSAQANPYASNEPISYSRPTGPDNPYTLSPTQQNFPALRSVASSQSCVDSMPHLPSISSTSSGDYRSNSFSGPIQTGRPESNSSFTSWNYTKSPPPPYANSTPTTGRTRRRESYFALADARSDQIMAGSGTTGVGVVEGRAFVGHEPAYVEAQNKPRIEKTDCRSSGNSKEMSDHYSGFQAPPASAHPALRELEDSSTASRRPPSYHSSELEGSSPSPGPSRLAATELRQSWPLDSIAIRQTQSCSAFPVLDDTVPADEHLLQQAPKPTRRRTDPRSTGPHPTRPAPLAIRRKPVPYCTDTFKEVYLDSAPTKPPLDTLKEVSNDYPYHTTPGDTLKEVDDAPVVPPRLPQPMGDTLKEFAPDSPVVGPRASSMQAQLSPPLEPTSHLEMIRKRNLERKQVLKKPLRVVNA